jgi:hypothetical protein
VNAEFNWWLLIVGLVIGAALVWVILADSARREVDVTERERDSEARWIGDALRGRGARITDRDVREILDLHAAYLDSPPPDDPIEDDEPWLPDDAAEPEPAPAPNWPEPARASADADEDGLPRLGRRRQIDERHAEPRAGREA